MKHSLFRESCVFWIFLSWYEILNKISYSFHTRLILSLLAASLPVKELFREVDAEEEEYNCISSKFKDQANLVDK